MERAFADAKEPRGLRQFSGHGRSQAESQVAFLVLRHHGEALVRGRQAANKEA